MTGAWTMAGLIAAAAKCEADHRPDNRGLDDGPYLPGKAPRKKPPTKTPHELRAIRAKAWETRRAKAKGDEQNEG